MRSYKDIVGLAVILTVFIVAGFLLAGRPEGKSRLLAQELYKDPSVYNDRASGSKGCYKWVQALGYRPEVLRDTWTSLDHTGASALFVIDPETAADYTPLSGSALPAANDTILGPSDAPRLLDWVREGHTAILMSSRMAGHSSLGSGSETFADAIDVVAETAIRPGRREFAPVQPIPICRDILSIYSRSDSRLRRSADDAVALFGDSSGPLILSLSVGSGRLYIIADGEFASNENLPRAENAALLANILAGSVRPGATILFDEFHHGDVLEASGETIWGALGKPLQLAILQVVLGFIAVIGVLGVRFGPPIPLTRLGSRLSSEYIVSLANLYRRAEASPAALETIYRQFLRDMTGRLALPPDVALGQLADTASRRANVNKQDLQRLLATCEQRLDEKRLHESELVELTRQMGRFKKEIGIA